MRAALVLSVLAAGLAGPPAAAQALPTPFAAAAVDRDLFREGEVRRRNDRFAGWALDCDEIPRLAQRFCSLRALARDAAGTPLARLTLSTDERGRPAALVDLPLGLDLAGGVTAEPAVPLLLGRPSPGLAPSAREAAATAAGGSKAGRPGKGNPPGAVETDILRISLRPALCDPAGCHAVWPLRPAEIAALRAGAGLRLRFRASGREPRGFSARHDLPPQPLEAVVSSDGLAAALEASLRPEGTGGAASHGTGAVR